MAQPLRDRNFTLVLGGGGLKGLAHVGVLVALEELGATPTSIIGTSIGALIGAAWCSGMPASDVRAVALQVRRRDIFRVAHADMAFKRMRSPALYQRGPLAELVDGVLGNITFDDLQLPMGEDSPGVVVFNHSSHVDVKSPECGSCHAGEFRILSDASVEPGPMLMDPMSEGHHCGRCHDGETAFSVEDDCEFCHQD